jgi:hypothetical protein
VAAAEDLRAAARAARDTIAGMEDLPRPLYDGLVFPGHGMPRRVSMDRPGDGALATKWARLTQGQPTGGRAVILYDNTVIGPQIAGTPFLDLGGDDHDAEQMQIVIDSPRLLWRPFSELAGEPLQNIQGEYDNLEIDTTDDFPGTAAPIIWPPISVLIEFGTLTRTRILVDAVNGARVNVSASAVRAWAVITADATNQPGTSAAYALRAFATPGWPTTGDAQRTVWLGSIAGGGLGTSDVFAVPEYAREVTLVGCDVTATPPAVTVGYIRFWQSPDGAAGGRNVGNFFVSGAQPGPFRVPNGAAYFDVVSGMGAAAHFAALFTLAV